MGLSYNTKDHWEIAKSSLRLICKSTQSTLKVLFEVEKQN